MLAKSSAAPELCSGPRNRYKMWGSLSKGSCTEFSRAFFIKEKLLRLQVGCLFRIQVLGVGAPIVRGMGFQVASLLLWTAPSSVIGHFVK